MRVIPPDPVPEAFPPLRPRAALGGHAERRGSNREDKSHEICAEWDGHCGRPGYRSASMGSNKRYTNDAIARRAISVIGADGIDGLAYAQPPG